MPTLLARLDGPWPLVIFAVAVICQVGAAAWQRWRQQNLESTATTGDLESILGRMSSAQDTSPESAIAPLTEAERAAIRERQLRGTGNWRNPAPPLPAPPPLPAYETTRESGPGPTTENWVPWEESTAALNEAHARLAQADVVATESLPPLRAAPEALRAATERLAAADQLIQQARATRRSENVARPAPTGLAAELARSLREPATARGAVIAGVLLGRPKCLEE